MAPATPSWEFKRSRLCRARVSWLWVCMSWGESFSFAEEAGDGGGVEADLAGLDRDVDGLGEEEACWAGGVDFDPDTEAVMGLLARPLPFGLDEGWLEEGGCLSIV